MSGISLRKPAHLASIVASRPTGAEPPKVHPRGRVCKHEFLDGGQRVKCATILSIYNPEAFCELHLQESVPKKRKNADKIYTRECDLVDCRAPFTTSAPQRKYCSDRCKQKAAIRRWRARKKAGPIALRDYSAHMAEEKICLKCGAPKPMKEYHLRSDKSGGPFARKNVCKECINAKRRKT